MIKKILVLSVLATAAGVLAFGFINNAEARGGNSAAAAGRGGYGVQSRGSVGVATASTAATSGVLSADEAAALLYMREEEKLAHDVYTRLYTQWGLPIFQNISQSEQTHSAAILTLLNRYGLTDPASSQMGVFANPDLQALYTQLMAQGSDSLAEALKVGAFIEETDIADLTARLAQTDRADIQQVFNNLLRGSGNHLRAFASTLSAQTGETYSPQVLSEADYRAIHSTSGTSGGGNGSQAGHRGGRS